ncbi:hypothetical protein QBC34DRAFT_398294 [Podospora aff. communis PSN243]|uniref:Uncharacterized protein n=1 Tax=Podospora aff. communis PSN243 TaxID=3040156 RepID=A0AAV9GVB4_9PEZI|nr:hypothetical protein QBC34DRAFT_398294 [Podospora aff. communis PSN243]
MFEVPDAKRVRREDLFDSASGRESSPDEENDSSAALLRAKLNAQLSNLLAVNIDAGPGEDEDVPMGEDGANEQPPEEEFEFRLFSTSGPSQKIVLAAEGEKHEGPALSQRPISFYVRGELTPEELEKFKAAAVSSADVIAEARKRAWGLEVPWRVTKIVVSTGRNQGRAGPRSAVAPGLAVADGELGKRKRPGKKRRIKLRKEEKAKQEDEKKKMTKEEHLKEKKKRLNREKKIKRRQKEKEKKAAMKGGAESNNGDESASGVESE